MSESIIAANRYIDVARVPSEHDEQVSLFQWADIQRFTLPELNLLFAIPNAGAGAQKGQAGKMKAEGVKKGIPDTMLPVARGRYHGAFIEMKRLRGGRVEPEQTEWHENLRLQGYFVAVCYGWVNASETILEYLRGEL